MYCVVLLFPPSSKNTSRPTSLPANVSKIGLCNWLSTRSMWKTASSANLGLLTARRFKWERLRSSSLQDGRLMLAPYTKIEDSFNLHVVHDSLLHGVLVNYDHFIFSGAISRTLIGTSASLDIESSNSTDWLQIQCFA
ncbi:hypothetical protein BT96DRAFT_924588 [Gymnopus androsaceus JB14]|uniref:Uncharacterized protein n=1 Tax=Gymnopus androsaceus JB14 TaxID=1447944 RepID=A0A6A4H5I1_9AGAR|nr:hypothetical protein BT96DRAFT_924588 [Gymnopus androsaceus JB14]